MRFADLACCLLVSLVVATDQAHAQKDALSEAINARAEASWDMAECH
jgi:hypothetical protein